MVEDNRRRELLQRFESSQLDAAEFDHAQHVRAAYEMLTTYPFLEAVTRYTRAIQAMALSVGVPEKFNLTVTLAFLSLIAERIDSALEPGFEKFIRNNRDLLKKEILGRWYSKERLQSELARKQFVLPVVNDLGSTTVYNSPRYK